MNVRRFAAFVVAGCLAAPASAGSFAQHHPDQWFRGLGIDAWGAGRHDESIEQFRRSARYADKTSQLVLAKLHFSGQGVAQDRALAYAWADLAAERGYPLFLRERELIWAALDESERARALEIGADLYREFGDDVAKPRLERHLRRGRAQKTGSRAGGSTDVLSVQQMDSAGRAALLASIMTSPHGANPIAVAAKGVRMGGAFAQYGFSGAVVASNYYDEANWRPEDYWRYQDALWMPAGEVEVGELRRKNP